MFTSKGKVEERLALVVITVTRHIYPDLSGHKPFQVAMLMNY